MTQPDQPLPLTAPEHDCTGTFGHDLHAERRERLFVERSGGREVRHGNRNVVDLHGISFLA
jgi:hypothetical protein